MQAILADIGNSSIKLVVVDRESCHFKTNAVRRLDSKLADDSLSQFLAEAKGASLSHCFVSSVNNEILRSFLKQLQTLVSDIDCHVLTADDVALETDVQSRTSLGIDRLLAANAAVQMVGHQPDDRKPLIVIDSGTAVTIDLVDASGVFRGGVIFPGAETSFRSLHRSTGDLPDVFDQWKNVNLELAIGNSTESAILTGVLTAQACSIQGIVDRITKTRDVDPVVFATGGGLEPVRKLLPNDWHYTDHLVLHGIAATIGNSDQN
jgi:type III pantothenate kinase